MKIKLTAITKNKTKLDYQIDLKINKMIIDLNSINNLIKKMNNNTLTDDELYQEIIKLYHIAEGKHGKTKIYLNSNKYTFQYLKTNITIANQLSIKNAKTNETQIKILYYPCIMKIALNTSLNPEHHYSLDEITNLIKTRQVVLWDIVWPTKTFDPISKYTKDIKEGYTDFNLYTCIYPNNNTIMTQSELNTFTNKYLISNQKLKTLKLTNPKEYSWILNYIKSYFTKTQLEKDKKELEFHLKKILENIKDSLTIEQSKPKVKKLLNSNTQE